MRAGICWEVGEAAWSRFFDACPDASLFHGPAWHAAWQEESGQRIVPVAFRFDDGERAMAILSVARTHRGLARGARSGVAGGYGGLIAPRPLTARHVELAHACLRRRFPELSVLGSPHFCWPNVPLNGTSQTATLALQLADLPVLRQRYHEQRRREASHGHRYTVLSYDHPSPGALAPFLDLYQHAARVGGPSRPATFWLALSRHLGPDLSLHLAAEGGPPVAALLVARHGAITYDLAFAVGPGAGQRQAATAVTEAALAHAHGSGQTWFDFMPSGSLAGLWRFKASFGARPMPILEARFHGGLNRLLGGARQALGRT